LTGGKSGEKTIRRCCVRKKGGHSIAWSSERRGGRGLLSFQDPHRKRENGHRPRRGGGGEKAKTQHKKEKRERAGHDLVFFSGKERISHHPSRKFLEKRRRGIFR